MYLVGVVFRFLSLLVILAATACSTPRPVIDTTTPSFAGAMPADLSGSWERDYTRGEDVQAVLNQLLYERNRQIQARQQLPNDPRAVRQAAGISRREVDAIIALARLVEEITRPDVLTISQDEFEVRIARRDDFSISCSFFEGIARGTNSAYGTEVCGWDGNDLISHLILPGLQITHRFTMSRDGEQLRVITTASSSATRQPFRLQRFYVKFDAPPSAFNCIETLSMKRVCSTAEIRP